MFNKILFKLQLRFPFLSKLFHVTDGYIAEPLKDEDYVFGASPLIKKVIQPDGQWDNFLPPEEIQRGYRFDSMGCVSFSCLNVLEMLAKKKWEKKWNRSDRFTAKCSGTSTRGNTMSRVIESVRKNDGTVSEEDWSWTDKFSWAEFYRAIPANIYGKGKNFLKEYQVGYEAVLSNVTAMKSALQYSPLWIAGYAWRAKNGIYYNYGRANHCFLVYGYEDGKYWKAYDSYPPYRKKLAWNYRFSYPKVLLVDKRDKQYNIVEIQKLIKQGIKYVMRVHDVGQIYELLKDGLKYIDAIEWNNLNVKQAAKEGKLQPRSEEDFYRLIE